MNKEMLALLQLIKQCPTGTSEAVANELAITRQSASRKLSSLKSLGLIQSQGSGRSTRYELVKKHHHFDYALNAQLNEDTAYRQTLLPLIKGFAPNVVQVFQYGFTEMFNNAIDHSEGSVISVDIWQSPLSTEVHITDNGVGIFEKIQQKFELADIRQSIFELSKGKLTTDADNHTGEGIFFSSKIFDFFCISSKGWAFVHNHDLIDIMYEQDIEYVDGTKVMFELPNNSNKTTKEVFDQFSDPNEYTFFKTVVPIHLAKYEGEFLISRSQAKRLTARFERFEKVILDFKDVTSIGQGFADELFRVYQTAHPNIELYSINANEEVQQMINRIIPV
ncbi:STAS-like domain-containing protein [Caviibacterium pharyngocola]|nr:DUF4325 domain-containing protein [Caviibacterium pharyngocola]